MQNPTKIIIIEIPNGVDAVDAVNVEAIPLKNKFPIAMAIPEPSAENKTVL